jgi:acyl carrier protein
LPVGQPFEGFPHRGKPAGAFVETEPGNTLEAALSNLWKKVLGRRQIGINENFFEAGGTSLKAVQVIALIQKELRRGLSITSLFESPTIKLLAAELKRASDSGRDGTKATKAHMRGQQRRHIKKTRRKSA